MRCSALLVGCACARIRNWLPCGIVSDRSFVCLCISPRMHRCDLQFRHSLCLSSAAAGGAAPAQPAQQGMQPPMQAGSGRFIQPLSQCDMVVTNIIQELQRDSWPAKPACRPSRCTGMSHASLPSHLPVYPIHSLWRADVLPNTTNSAMYTGVAMTSNARHPFLMLFAALISNCH